MKASKRLALANRVVAGLLFGVAAAAMPAEDRPRIRDLGVSPGIFHPGPLNAITDVDGVRVGQRTLIEGDSVRTGVTVILPAGDNLFQRKCPAAVYVGNGFGKAAGFLQVAELGNLETPIVLTNTLAVGTAVDAVVQWTLVQPGNQGVRSVNAVVGETNDGWELSDIRAQRVSAADVFAAIAAARGGAVEEGSVGAGTGTVALGWKGGIGTSSRKLPDSLTGYTVGAIVQTNYGGVLTIDGVRVGEALGRFEFQDTIAKSRRAGDGSCMIVLATDAPLSSRNLERLAKRAVLGLARTGSFMGNGSGDFVIAFSTKNRVPNDPAQPLRRVEELENDAMDPLFLAAVESVEEAVYNSLTRATTVTGAGGRTVEAIPIARLKQLLAARGPTSAVESGCRATDLMPGFWSFWEKARGRNAADQYGLFEEIVRKPNSAVYEGAFQGLTKPPEEFVPRSLEGVPSIEADLRGLSGRLAADLPGELAAFQKSFPRFRCSTPVYFLYSAGAFDGATRDVAGKTALMFGLDVIARLKEELSPLVVHELFHVYHRQAVAEDPETFGWALWSEGLATYVSGRLNPSVPEQQVCCLPPIAPAQAVLPRIAAEALQLLDSEKPEDNRRYFLGGAELDIPSRSGYYLGYRIATAAGKTRTLEELAALTPSQVRALEVPELQRMAGGK